MKLRNLLFGLVLAAVGCGTTSAYTGPVGDQPLARSERYNYVREDVRFPEWTSRTILHVANPSFQPVSVTVDCKNNTMHLDIPGRTVQDLLILPEDGKCVVTRD
jgi:uncharacterized protein YceK